MNALGAYGSGSESEDNAEDQNGRQDTNNLVLKNRISSDDNVESNGVKGHAEHRGRGDNNESNNAAQPKVSSPFVNPEPPDGAAPDGQEVENDESYEDEDEAYSPSHDIQEMFVGAVGTHKTYHKVSPEEAAQKRIENAEAMARYRQESEKRRANKQFQSSTSSNSVAANSNTNVNTNNNAQSSSSRYDDRHYTKDPPGQRPSQSSALVSTRRDSRDYYSSSRHGPSRHHESSSGRRHNSPPPRSGNRSRRSRTPPRGSRYPEGFRGGPSRGGGGSNRFIARPRSSRSPPSHRRVERQLPMQQLQHAQLYQGPLLRDFGNPKLDKCLRIALKPSGIDITLKELEKRIPNIRELARKNLGRELDAPAMAEHFDTKLVDTSLEENRLYVQVVAALRKSVEDICGVSANNIIPRVSNLNASGAATLPTTGGQSSIQQPASATTMGNNSNDPNKFLEQQQKRKMLWSGAKSNAPKTETQWQTNSQVLGGSSNKFQKLMGIKNPTSSSNAPSGDAPLPSNQTKMFADLERQYEQSRVFTHTNRGVGLGAIGSLTSSFQAATSTNTMGGGSQQSTATHNTSQ